MSEPHQGLVTHLSVDRLSTYLAATGQDLDSALALYAWNARVAGSLWETIGHLEIPLRNALDRRLTARHQRSGLSGDWTRKHTFPEFEEQLAKHIPKARGRVRRKGKQMRHGQIVAELSLSFWRFMLSRQHTNLWPDLAGAFPHAPDRRRETIETPLIRIHDLRNRLAHHEAVWALPLDELYNEVLTLLGYISPDIQGWVIDSTGFPQVLAQQPLAPS